MVGAVISFFEGFRLCSPSMKALSRREREIVNEQGSEKDYHFFSFRTASTLETTKTTIKTMSCPNKRSWPVMGFIVFPFLQRREILEGAEHREHVHHHEFKHF